MDKREKNKEYQRAYRKKNREKILEYKRAWGAIPENRAKILLSKKKYNSKQETKEHAREWQRTYNKRANVKKSRSSAVKKKRSIEQNFRLATLMRSRICKAVKRGYKSTKTKELLGCSFEDFKLYTETLFKEGMTWDNYGYNGWHIDHIIPCAIFDLSNEEEQRKCFNYKNLQPLWRFENQSKGAKI